MQVAVSVAGRTREGTLEASLEDVAIGQASAFTSPAPSTTEGPTPEELLPQEGSAPLGIRMEPSWSLVWVGSDPHVWGGSQNWWTDR